jgi:hypothetical protein
MCYHVAAKVVGVVSGVLLMPLAIVEPELVKALFIALVSVLAPLLVDGFVAINVPLPPSFGMLSPERPHVVAVTTSITPTGTE